jgi:Protein of unknown function (DUF3417)
MKPIATVKVRPCLPEILQPLLKIAYNLRWCWDHAAIDLFRRFDRNLWEQARRNPVRLLGMIDQRLLEAAARDESFLVHMNGVSEHLERYLAAKGAWYRREHSKMEGLLVAYFSLEFGITECVPIFAGGLGVLAGDHLKAASDLGLPLVGVGLPYQEGYFRSISTRRAGSRKRARKTIFIPCRSSASGMHRSVWRCRKASDRAGLARGGWAAVSFICWTRIFPRTSRNTGGLPVNCTEATWTCASGRRFCWALEGCGRWLASYSNGVSRLHGSVSRQMWNDIWKGLPTDEVPIGYVTNGVHFRSWVSLEMNQL